ncbi:MAG TPA: hypothetical protein PLQ80_06475 [Candidatus Syntrophosphaera sp.]|nr:hypothetical protein [Candidatus Syntrophosphaera sp.]
MPINKSAAKAIKAIGFLGMVHLSYLCVPAAGEKPNRSCSGCLGTPGSIFFQSMQAKLLSGLS